MTNRYHRQQLLPMIGPAGQARLSAARVVLIGCGALGTVIAEHLVRAGIGTLRLCDRDIVELTNLHRQTLYTERDVEQGTPKAVAASERLLQINSTVRIEARVIDVQPDNIESLLRFDDGDANLILDGTDNADVRYLINDVAAKHSTPWVYGACVGVEGRVMPVWPGVSACLRCVFRNPPGAGELPTCDTAGVLGPAAGVVASMQAAVAIRMLVERSPAAQTQLHTLDVWTGRSKSLDLSDARDANCPACAKGDLEFLNRASVDSARLCGRDTVQVRPGARQQAVNFEAVARRLIDVGEVQRTPYLLRFSAAGVSLTLFSDGRALVQGTSDLAKARNIYARYIGL